MPSQIMRFEESPKIYNLFPRLEEKAKEKLPIYETQALPDEDPLSINDSYVIYYK